MSRQYGRVAFTPAVTAVQRQDGRPPTAARGRPGRAPAGDPLTATERAFLLEQDSLFLATVSSTGWPYVQFRGGPPGFVNVLDDHTIAWADVGGNLQYISTGNLAEDDRVAIIVLDAARRARLKLYGHATVTAADEAQDRLARLVPRQWPAAVERLVEVSVVAYDWNCPDHITPRFTAEQVQVATAALQARVEELSRANAELRRRAGAGAAQL